MLPFSCFVLNLTSNRRFVTMSDSQSGSESDEATGTQSSNGYNSTMQQSSEQSSRSTDDESDEDVPLSQKVKRSSSPASNSGNGVKRRRESDNSDDEDVPLSHKKNGKVKQEPESDHSGDRSDSDYSDGDDSDYGDKKKKKKKKTAATKKKKAAAPKAKSSSKKKRKKESSDEEDEDSDTGDTKKKKKKAKKVKKEKTEKGKKSKSKSRDSDSSPTKGSPKKKVKEEDQEHIWKWWEESDLDSDRKWKSLEHKGPVFAPDYEPLPAHVKFFYDKKPFKLAEPAEEVATFYAKMLDHEYVTKDIFNKNFFKDWRKVMSSSEKEKITSLEKCDFSKMNDYFKEQSEIRKNMSKEEKKKIKEANDKLNEEYGIAIVDGHKQKIGNFRLEPPGLFRGRGNHPKMGKVKNRILARDIIINIGKKAVVPAPPPGQKWKEVRHDQHVTWLASWTENIMGNVKYIMLNPSSKLKSMKDWRKYEVARELHSKIDQIRDDYKRDWKDREMFHRQRAVALYFIDRLALRAGNEKDDSEAADTVGCCSLRVEHIKLYDEIDGQEYVIEFDFLGKDSIRYFNRVPVQKQVFKNMKHFMEGKGPGDDLFDRLDTMKLNNHLKSLMEGLSAKVFRTYNASITLERELKKLMKEKSDMSMAEKVLAYNRANRTVAILCNHQRTVPKGFEGQMEKLKEKISAKEDQIREVQSDLKRAKKAGDENEKSKCKKKLKTLQEQLEKLKVQETDKEENKQIALGTSKLNYLDPRITVAWYVLISSHVLRSILYFVTIFPPFPGAKSMMSRLRKFTPKRIGTSSAGQLKWPVLITSSKRMNDVCNSELNMTSL